MLGYRVTVTKSISLILVTIGAMAVNFYLIPPGYFFGSVTLFAQALMLFTLFVLRRQGWRFVNAKI
jgi:hypothetical protein